MTWTRICCAIAASTWFTTASFAKDDRCNTDFVAENARLRLEVLASIRHPHPNPLLQHVCKKFSASSVAYDPASRRLFVANPFDAVLETYDVRIPGQPTPIGKPLLLGGDSCDPDNPVQCRRPNHVAAANGIVAVTVVNNPATDPGRLILLDADGTLRHELVVGPSPTWVAFTPDGARIVVANQGVPSDDYRFDPEGSISIIENWRSSTPNIASVTLRSFNDRKEDLIAKGVRIYAPCLSASLQPCEVTVAQDLEPVSLVVSPDSAHAWITFETNNALGFLDIARGLISEIRSFGLKDHSKWRNRLDAAPDGSIDLRTWPVYGMVQANGIDVFRTHSRTYLITANRGNWRESNAFPGESERTTVREACAAGRLDRALCYDVPINGHQGLVSGIPELSIARYPYRYDADPAAPLSAPFTYGGRSFAIWTPTGELVHDSGAALEAITKRACPEYFNSQSDQNTFDDRSDDKGPEPEGVITARVAGREFAFVTLRRIGGTLVFDISEPSHPVFQQYINNRDFNVDPKDLPPIPGIPAGSEAVYFVNCAAKDLQAVKPVFVPGADAPDGEPLLLLVNNYSGSVTIYRVRAKGCDGREAD